MKTAIKSFYWVAAAQDDPSSAAWHLDVLDTAETMDEVAALGGLTRERQLTPAMAEAEGLSLSVIAAQFGVEAAARCSAHEAEADQLRAQMAEAAAAHKASVEIMVEGHLKERSAQAEAHKAEVARLAAELDAERQAHGVALDKARADNLAALQAARDRTVRVAEDLNGE